MRQLRDALVSGGFAIERTTYFNSWLFPRRPLCGSAVGCSIVAIVKPGPTSTCRRLVPIVCWRVCSHPNDTCSAAGRCRWGFRSSPSLVGPRTTDAT
ncbi:MAG: hypothetical protein H0U29_03205 [Acidimicrobiia bacterium]|nr:hypothetical protein [Acidimicrobiia bacterium]